MRNLKKVLALVLTLAMMLSVMVMNASAFSDDKDIADIHQEAVDMCVSLSIINGYTDGSFRPNGDITRAEMCKMICVAMNGGKAPVVSASATPVFTDVPSTHWAVGYVESCAAQGIVAGIGGGKFNPDGKVTGTEAAKMLLISLGFDAQIEGFVGSSWDVNTNVKATQKGLYENLEDIDVTAPLTREHAAEMIWNTLQADEVDYDYTLVSENGQLTSKVTVKSTKEQAMGDWYGAKTIEDKVIADVTYDSDKEEYTVELVSGETYTCDKDFSDLFRHNVDVVLDKNGDLLGFVDNTDVLASGIVNDLDENTDGNSKLMVGDNEYKLDTADNAVPCYDFLNGSFTLSSADKAWQIDLLDTDDNGKGDTFVVYPVYVAEVTYVGSKGITAGASYTFEDDDIYDGVDEDDYAFITKAVNNVDEDVNVVVKADLTSATVTGVKADKVQLDGTWYPAESTVSVGVKDEVDAVILNGVVVATEETDSSVTDVLYVSAVDVIDSEFDSDEYTQDVKAWFLDGSKAVITVSEIEGDDIDASHKVTPKALYTYEKDGDNYTLEAVSTSNDAGYDKVKVGVSAGYTKDSDKLAGYKVADDAVIFVQEGNDVDVISGKSLKDWNDTWGTDCGALANESNGINYAEVGYVIGAANSPASLGDVEYGFVTGDPYLTTIEDDGDDVDVVAVEVWTENGADTLYVESSKLSDVSVGEGDTVSFQVDGLYVDKADLKAVGTEAAITGYEAEEEGDVNYYDADSTEKTAAMDEDVVFIGICTDDTDKCELIDVTDLQLAQSKTDGKWTANSYIVLNTAGDIIAIFMDVDNELDGGSEFVK